MTIKKSRSGVNNNNYRHGKRYTKLYYVWMGIKQRCTNPNNPDYKYYGGRGITLYPSWESNFLSFEKWALNNGYKDKLQIDRIDNNRGYCPNNCRWVTAKSNCKNRRNNVLVIAFGETKCVSEWAEDSRCSITRHTLGYRLKNGWSPELAITTKLKRRIQ